MCKGINTNGLLYLKSLGVACTGTLGDFPRMMVMGMMMMMVVVVVMVVITSLRDNKTLDIKTPSANSFHVQNTVIQM